MNGCTGLRGRAFFSLTTWSGEGVTAIYAADCDFTHGKARITVSLVKHRSGWRIAGFKVTRASAHPATPAKLEYLDASLVRAAA